MRDRQLRLHLVNLKSSKKMLFGQKLKSSFFKESDKGTKFFHALMKQKHRENFIPSIMSAL